MPAGRCWQGATRRRSPESPLLPAAHRGGRAHPNCRRHRSHK
jgi:hypothetical protein